MDALLGVAIRARRVRCRLGVRSRAPFYNAGDVVSVRDVVVTTVGSFATGVESDSSIRTAVPFLYDGLAHCAVLGASRENASVTKVRAPFSCVLYRPDQALHGLPLRPSARSGQELIRVKFISVRHGDPPVLSRLNVRTVHL